MTVGDLMLRLEIYPKHYEVLMELNGQKDIFTIFDLVFSGEYKPFQEDVFESKIGEIVNSERRNCVGFMRTRKDNE